MDKKIRKIVGSFVATTINSSGYILEDGEVFLILKGVPMNREDFNRKTLMVLGFTATHEKIGEYNLIYDTVATEYRFDVNELDNGSINELVKESCVGVDIPCKISDIGDDMDVSETTEVVKTIKVDIEIPVESSKKVSEKVVAPVKTTPKKASVRRGAARKGSMKAMKIPNKNK